MGGLCQESATLGWSFTYKWKKFQDRAGWRAAIHDVLQGTSSSDWKACNE